MPHTRTSIRFNTRIGLTLDEQGIPKTAEGRLAIAGKILERAEACRKDADYGRIVCRCEVITEAEIRDAIRRPVGAKSIDGVKRRTRAGMGRCQGGFCSPRVAEILCEELGCSPLDITKCGGESKLLAGTLDDIAKEARGHE